MSININYKFPFFINKAAANFHRNNTYSNHPFFSLAAEGKVEGKGTPLMICQQERMQRPSDRVPVLSAYGNGGKTWQDVTSGNAFRRSCIRLLLAIYSDLVVIHIRPCMQKGRDLQIQPPVQ